jgi:arginine N-succinyltransferase
MSFVVRAAGPGDLEALYRMAKSTGGGFTNLPPDRGTLCAKLERAAACFARPEDTPADDLFVFILEDPESGETRGTCQIFAAVGTRNPFYSYRIAAMSQHSQELGRTFRAELLQLTTDLDGSSEVGGLFLAAGERSAGVGKLLARSRYLFMAMHRRRFADTTIAELRGAIDDTGNSPFWDGVAGRFFGMSFREADEFNGVNGHQFIADLMPKHPIYTAMIADSALAVIGVPHASGRAAMRMLEDEGFHWDSYIDIFDGGPTMRAPTDRIATIAAAREATITAIDLAVDPDGGPATHLIAAGRLGAFRATLAHVGMTAGGIAIDAASARLIGVAIGDSVTFAPR